MIKICVRIVITLRHKHAEIPYSTQEDTAEHQQHQSSKATLMACMSLVRLFLLKYNDAQLSCVYEKKKAR